LSNFFSLSSLFSLLRSLSLFSHQKNPKSNQHQLTQKILSHQNLFFSNF
jgi:hypothetical protein